MGKKIKLLVLFTCVHAMLALGTSLYAMAASSTRFDNPELPPAFAVSAAAIGANVLMSPGLLVWTSWASKNLSNGVEWLLFLANSASWGALGVVIATKFSNARGQRLRARDVS
jgi:hypothetical protein